MKTSQAQISMSRDGERLTIVIDFSLEALCEKPLPAPTPVTPEDEPLISRKSSPAIAMVSPSTLDRRVKEGKVAYTKIGERKFFKKSDLLSLRKEIRLRSPKF